MLNFVKLYPARPSIFVRAISARPFDRAFTHRHDMKVAILKSDFTIEIRTLQPDEDIYGFVRRFFNHTWHYIAKRPGNFYVAFESDDRNLRSNQFASDMLTHLD